MISMYVVVDIVLDAWKIHILKKISRKMDIVHFVLEFVCLQDV